VETATPAAEAVVKAVMETVVKAIVEAVMETIVEADVVEAVSVECAAIRGAAHAAAR
jgi:hypothetical protein